MNPRALGNSGWFLAAAGLHAGVIFGWGEMFVASPEFAMSVGESVELTLVESAPEPAAEVTPPEPEPPAAPEPEPVSEPPEPPPEPEMIEPEPEPPPPPKPVVTPRPPRRPTPTKAQPSAQVAPAQPAGVPGNSGPSGVRTLARPNYLSNPPPPYPAAAKQAGEQGVVQLRVSVTEQGRAGSVRISRSSGFSRLDEAARLAVQRWRFSPARIGGIAVSSEVTVPVRFQLR